MNKWQIICPVILMLIVGLWCVHNKAAADDKALRAAIERQLSLVLAELEKNQVAGCLPAIDAARTILNDEAAAKRVNVTSLFGTKDLFYNPLQPRMSSDDPVFCARVGERLFRIRANRKVDEVSRTDFQQAGFVSLATTGSVRMGPNSPTNR